MFALDNLVKSAVHVGLTILSPELADNLAGNDRELTEVDDDEVDELSNSVSTVNSAKTKHHSGKENYEHKFLLEQFKLLKNENTKLINELLESQKNLMTILKTNDYQIFADALKGFLQQLSTFSRQIERSISCSGYCSDDQMRKASISAETSPTPEENDKPITSVNSKKLQLPPLFRNPQLKSPFRQCHDLKLMEWLSQHGFDEEARASISIADFTYEDFIYNTDKDDIRRIGLR
jgi:hypothetical protein